MLSNQGEKGSERILSTPAFFLLKDESKSSKFSPISSLNTSAWKIFMNASNKAGSFPEDILKSQPLIALSTSSMFSLTSSISLITGRIRSPFLVYTSFCIILKDSISCFSLWNRSSLILSARKGASQSKLI